jgi:hypothetical protein
MVARKRIPFAFWRGMHAWMGGNAFEKSAAKNGIGKKELRARPYASKAGDARAPIEPAAPPLP